MTLAEQLMAWQKRGYDFEDLVSVFMSQVSEETVVSQPNSPKYEAIWVFNDGSCVNLLDEVFTI